MLVGIFMAMFWLLKKLVYMLNRYKEVKSPGLSMNTIFKILFHSETGT